jgi:hypothetical protein
LEIASPGVPISFHLEGTVPLTQIFVGSQKASPRAKDFDLAMQDRHGMAWADFNDDGRLDVFVTRGAIGGTLRMFPENMSSRIRDELLVSQPGGRYQNIGVAAGIEKRDCSGRQVKWVDVNRDGLLDLFINCQPRGYVKGAYPKQLYIQNADKTFSEGAAAAGLDIPDHEIIDLLWTDADNDGQMDLLTYEEVGFFLYRNRAGKFSREYIGRGKFARADNPKLAGTSDEYWFVDGKLAVADFNLDGSLDVFSASKKGNTVLVNDGKGGFALVDPVTIGLPGESATAAWVDYDNDGLPDLYAVPQGLFRQRRDHTFEATGLLVLPPGKYMAALVDWPDFDNDGARDILLAVLENFSLWGWPEKFLKTADDRFKWRLAAYRNTRKGNHWIELRLSGKPGNAQAIGARVMIRTPAGEQTQEVGFNDGAFFSQGHYRLYFGLGDAARIEVIRIRWPDGQLQDLKDVAADRLLVVKQDAVIGVQ